MKKTSRRYALSQFAIHGEMMMMRYRDKTLKFEYYCTKYNEWREASVPQWEEDTKYRIANVYKSDSKRLKIPKTTKEQRVQLNEGYNKK